MPDWTSNEVVITADKDTLKEIKNRLATDERIFDFNAIIPMPEELDITSGSITDMAILAYASNKLTDEPDKTKENWAVAYKLVTNVFYEDAVATLYKALKERPRDNINELYDLGKRYVDNYLNYDAPTWYEWSCQNWNTKWNASSPDLEEDEESLTYYFDTAWDAPHPVIKKLSELYPGATIEHAFANAEDRYAHKATYKGGEEIC